MINLPPAVWKNKSKLTQLSIVYHAGGFHHKGDII